MARSVVLKGTPRCERCQLAPRWCICPELATLTSPLRVDVLMHHMESYRPSSTGHVIKRIIPDSGLHLFRPETPFNPETIAVRGRELWILHPNGEPMPPAPDPTALQILLLDANWVQSNFMLRSVEKQGRKISLPMQGESRYWLRTQKGDGHFSTIEALLFLFAALGLKNEHAALRLQFELHVYAGLCSRGHKLDAESYLASSPVRAAFPELIARFQPRESRFPRWQKKPASPEELTG